MPTDLTLASHTTIGVGGPADGWVVATTEAELVGAVVDLDRAGTPILILGGGSNLLVSDAGFRGTVVQVASRGVDVEASADGVAVTAAAGEPWDELVTMTVDRGWAGLEALSGIPGLVGATPVQNVGAYGQEVAQVISAVRVLDRRDARVVRLERDECGFGYRTSLFKDDPDRYVVLEVRMELGAAGVGVIAYAELARALGVEVGGIAPVAEIRNAVLGLRRAKGMVLDPDDPDTRSLGSFFINPVVDEVTASAIDPRCPRYPSAGGVKLSAAWLVEHAGIDKGWSCSPDSPAGVSTKHTLALTNRGGASTQDVIDLAHAITAEVQAAFGITLHTEPRAIDCGL